MRREEKIIVSIALIAGIAAGVAASQLNKAAIEEERAYCAEVESGIQQNMTQGFVNCVTPRSFSTNLSEEVSKKSDLQCICRKKVGNRIQQLKITTSR